ncbi:MAG: VCBS repeat-containing protein [Pirellulaceae bacterium]
MNRTHSLRYRFDVALRIAVSSVILLVGCTRHKALPGDVVDSEKTPPASVPTDLRDKATVPVEHAASKQESLPADLSCACADVDAAVDDPRQDGWQTEVFSQHAVNQLNRLLQLSINDAVPSVDQLASLTVPNVKTFQLAPAEKREVCRSPSLVIYRWEEKDRISQSGGSLQGLSGISPREATDTFSDTATGRGELLESLSGLHAMLRAFSTKQQKVKVVRVEIEPTTNRAWTTVLWQAYGKSTNGALQLNVSLLCAWDTSNSAQPQLSALSTVRYEEVHSSAPAGVWFREYTPAVLKGVAAYTEQLSYSADYWAQRIEKRLGTNLMGYHGVTVGDVNGDLLDDVYLCQPGGTPNILLIQQPDGTVRDASASYGVDLLDACRCALLLDIDNDDDQDLVISSITGTLFYENDGQGHFEFRQRIRGGRLAYTMTAADYDGDHDIDVYVCLYHAPPEAEIGNPVPYHDANNGSPNVLIANDGQWTFHDATTETGLDQNNHRWSYAASWDDYDDDGDPDLYVANDFGRNNLYENDGGHFVDVAARAGVEDIASGMSVSWGDYNRDGRMDLYVSNMFSAAGGRVTYQRQFNSTAAGATRNYLQRLARGNSLFENRGDGTFEDVTQSMHVEMGRWAWSSNFCDLNNDGWEDLVVANGNYTGEDTGDL